MKGLALAILTACAVACGGRTELFDLAPFGGQDAAASGDAKRGADGGDLGDTGADDAADMDGEGGEAPVPTCTGENSKCVESPNSVWVGAAIIDCAPVDFVGPWTLLLQRSVSGQFQTIQVQVVQTPGFGATFTDESSPADEVTYQVCVVDHLGTRCGTPFTTTGPPGCACEPLTCQQLQMCNTAVDNGCGRMVTCAECNNGATCNPAHTCCGVGFMPDGTGDCVCAPPHRCPRGTYWDTSLCTCANAG